MLFWTKRFTLMFMVLDTAASPQGAKYLRPSAGGAELLSPCRKAWEMLARIIHEGSRIYAFRWCLVERCKPRLSRKHPVRFLLIVVRSRVGHGSSHRHGDPAREKSIKNV